MRHAAIILHHAWIDPHGPIWALMGGTTSRTKLIWIEHHVLLLLLLLLLRLLNHVLLSGRWGRGHIRVVARRLCVVDTANATVGEAAVGRSVHGWPGKGREGLGRAGKGWEVGQSQGKSQRGLRDADLGMRQAVIAQGDDAL